MSRRTASPTLWQFGNGTPPEVPFIALVPGEEAPLLPLDIPPGLKGAARERVARRQVSDVLALPPETLEIRPAPGAAPAALVVAAERHADWGAALAGTACTALLPDYLALPAAEGLWVLQVVEDRLCARLGPLDGFSAELALAPALLAAALARDRPRAVLAPRPLPDAVLALLADLPVESDPAALPADLAPRPMGAPERAMDLLRNPAAVRAELRAGLRHWRAPSVLAVLALALWIGAVRHETADLRAQARLHRQAAETVARQVFLPQGPIIDLRVQVAREVEARRTAAGAAATEIAPLDLFQRAAPVLLDSGAEVQRVSWRPATGLVIDLRAPDFAALDGIAAALRAAALRVEVAQSVAGETAGVSATLGLAGG